jgi:hypothetical protein
MDGIKMQIIKKINVAEIRKTLESLSCSRDGLAQPDLVYGCYLSLNKDNYSVCKKCRHYEKCLQYLKMFEIKK